MACVEVNGPGKAMEIIMNLSTLHDTIRHEFEE
jgi:hypothetical protein